MIPSRGLRWSGQTIGIGRRCVNTYSARQFSASIHHGPVRANSLLSKNVTSAFKYNTPSRPIDILRYGAGIRFASTATVPTSSPAAASANIPSETAASSPSPAPIAEYNTSLDSVTDLASESIYNIPESIGYLKALGLDYGWGPTAMMEWILEHVHIFAGTPWWVSITLTAILVRAVLFKPYIDAAENSARLATVQPLTKPVTARMQAASTLGDVDQAMQLRGELQRIHKRAGIKIWKNFVPMLQVFAGYGTFVLLRAMARLPVPGLETGGALWFTNLTLPDPIYALPIATSAVLHWVLRKGGETGVSNFSPQTFKAMMWGLPAISLLFTFWLPSALQLSFFVSGLCSFGQASLLRQTWFREYFKMTPIPQTPNNSPKPADPYRGKLKVAANPVLSQAQLNARFQGAQEAKKSNESTGAFRKIAGTVGKVTDAGPIGEIKDAFKGVVQKSRESQAKSNAKADIKRLQRYEEKRQEELKKQRWEIENQKRAERAARKRAGL